MNALARGRRPADQPRHDLGDRTARYQQGRRIYLFATVATIVLFWLGTRRRTRSCRRALQNTAESGVGFVRNQIIMQTMGADGLGYLPYLTTLFFFIFFSNITEIIPGVQFPANARFGDAARARAVHVGDLSSSVGIIKQGPVHYLKNSTVPPGVPSRSCRSSCSIEFVCRCSSSGRSR